MLMDPKLMCNAYNLNFLINDGGGEPVTEKLFSLGQVFRKMIRPQKTIWPQKMDVKCRQNRFI